MFAADGRLQRGELTWRARIVARDQRRPWSLHRHVRAVELAPTDGPFGRHSGRSLTRSARIIQTSLMAESTAEKTASGSGRLIKLRYAGRCSCGAHLTPGSKAGWDAEARTVTCLDCLNSVAASALGVPASSASVPECSAVLPASVEASCTPPQPGIAGGAAGREYQRRKDKRDAETDALPFGLRKLARTVFNDPQHIRAWQSGERGEVEVARVLDRLAADSIPALHDRRIPHRRSNIDHIAIGPAGVYVIDAKRYVRQRVEVRRFGGLVSPRRSELFVGGRRKMDLVNGLAPQEDAVLEALAELELPTGHIVQPVLCFINADWSLLSRNLSVDGVAVVGPRGLKKLVQKPGPLDAQTRQQIYGCLARRLPSMT